LQSSRLIVGGTFFVLQKPLVLNMQFETIIRGQRIDLERLTNDHIFELESIAFDARIWQHLPYNITDKQSLETFIKEQQQKNLNAQQITYVIRNKTNGQVCGSTGFINIDTVNDQLEIGATWLSPIVWGTKINIESKYLLLTCCFEKVNVMRVEFRTREANIRSQKAIEKIGGIKEGLLRNHRKNDDGTFRNTIVYSIIQPEWSSVKTLLEVLISK
jgi:RimJ/RimL family protein N-acetyltransferase